MNDAKRGQAERALERREVRLRAVAALPARLERVTQAALPEGSLTVLIGEPGTGKASLAEAAAHLIGERTEHPTEVVTLLPPRVAGQPAPIFSLVDPAAEADGASGPTARASGAGVAADARRVQDHLERLAEGRALTLVVPDADDADPRDLAILERIMTEIQLRILITARRQTPAVARLRRLGHGSTLSIGPLSEDESERLLCVLLGVERIEGGTLRRWAEACGGNSHGLSMLAVAADQAGQVRRARGAAWAADDGSEADAPPEYAWLIRESCSAEEWELLERIAIAEPVGELALLRELGSATLGGLLERGLVVSRDVAGIAVLRLAHRLLGASIRAGLHPRKRLALNDEAFALLAQGLEARTAPEDPERLQRLVGFGLAAGRDLPLAWLWGAFRAQARAVDAREGLGIALALASHPEANDTQVAMGLARAAQLARKIGDFERLRVIVEAATRMIESGRITAVETAGIAAALQTVVIVERVWTGGSVEAALTDLDQLRESLQPDPVAEATTRSGVMIVLSMVGRVREAWSAAPRAELAQDLQVEVANAHGRTLRTLCMVQRGEIAQAVEESLRARMLNGLGRRIGAGIGDLLGFAWFVAMWVSGDSAGTREALAELTVAAGAQEVGDLRASGVAECCEVLLAIQEGRWVDAVDAGERAADRFERADSYGLAPFVHAARALAQAVLGERDAAARSLRRAADPTPGLAQALCGVTELLTLRARQWLEAPDTLAIAERLVARSEERGHAYVELLARHFVAAERGSVPAGDLARIQQLAIHIDAPLGDAVVAHVERLAHAARPGDDDTELRVLAEHGLWLPIPSASSLTPREREIALLAALGHTSRFISERLHISPRTVERHLSNLFGKLGVERRDDLREWALRERIRRHAAKNG
ncbi:hypothetical protein JD292_08925 [Leucobacter sp. CSA2]|uniref:HTH luxR-type domain-containing protein n=1 Tax=Leucobacter edaphi TaxID=2796472 RepID=A0A934QF76_9MICO|nr:LuxR family transcriptional regulator [Leucobacter edaphi]MBK0422197.1 hypothetical protein [Leucobacter edaphi]